MLRQVKEHAPPTATNVQRPRTWSEGEPGRDNAALSFLCCVKCVVIRDPDSSRIRHAPPKNPFEDFLLVIIVDRHTSALELDLLVFTTRCLRSHGTYSTLLVPRPSWQKQLVDGFNLWCTAHLCCFSGPRRLAWTGGGHKGRMRLRLRSGDFGAPPLMGRLHEFGMSVPVKNSHPSWYWGREKEVIRSHVALKVLTTGLEAAHQHRDWSWCLGQWLTTQRVDDAPQEFPT